VTTFNEAVCYKIPVIRVSAVHVTWCMFRLMNDTLFVYIVVHLCSSVKYMFLSIWW